MSNLLSRTSSRFEDWFSTEAGLKFQARLMPLADSAATTSTFIEPRHVLHTKPNTPVNIGDVFFDKTGQAFLLARHDTVPGLRRSFRVFIMNEKAPLVRYTTVKDTITGLEKTVTNNADASYIWITREVYGREEVDRALHAGFDKVRIITSADIQLNDQIDGKRVSRLIDVYGVHMAEIV